ncbi:MAG: alpha/beta hydrolase-fold protein [Acidimicrobiia bacterium]|nr:alpha/beta hydrolase-fold protein [Acidimicrobiia bacterium]
MNSPALGGRGDLAVHTTHGIDMPENVPVVVLLHGVYGSVWNWSLLGGAHTTLDRLVGAGVIGPMVLVMPSDGMRGEGTGYLRHPSFDAEGWIVNDVVDAVTEMIDEVTAGSPLFFGGNSMGGFGAARLGLRDDRVRAIAMHSAITHLDQLAQFTIDDIGTAAELDPAERDLLYHVDEHADRLPPVFLDCGRADPLAAANRELHEQLDDRGVDHEYAEFDGEHNWDSWSRRIENSLHFFDRHLEATQ